MSKLQGACPSCLKNVFVSLSEINLLLIKIVDVIFTILYLCYIGEIHVLLCVLELIGVDG